LTLLEETVTVAKSLCESRSKKQTHENCIRISGAEKKKMEGENIDGGPDRAAIHGIPPTHSLKVNVNSA